MAFVWRDIQNNESARSVRNKLNELGNGLKTETESITNTLNSEVGIINGKLKTLTQMVSIATNVTCRSNQWVEDTSYTYTEYPYKAVLSVQGVTSDMIPFVNFDANEQESGEFIGSESGSGTITIWAKNQPSDLIIPNIVLIKAVNIDG